MKINGTVSHGTMREQDLIPAFLACARKIVGDRVVEPIQLVQTTDHIRISLAAITKRQLFPGYFDSDVSQSDLEYLFDTLDYLAPKGYYFGAHVGDGSDFGFWENENDFDSWNQED
jgi:hypothetical protein